MDLPSKKVFDALLSKGVTELHHANSVLTSCEFLRSRSLLSRGTIERQKRFQTAQSSDDLDKRFNLWFDVFTDSVDIHERASRCNAYGPVLFVLDIEELRKSWTGRLWVTKKNPTRWESLSDEDRWFRSIEELESDFVYGDFGQMIVFRHCGGQFPFKNSLKEIILDDPQQQISKDKIDLYSMAWGALQLASMQGGLKVRPTKRSCGNNCKCLELYENSPRKTVEMFAPKLA